MADDGVPLRDEYIPYTANEPRRSQRQRFATPNYVPDNVPRLKAETPSAKKRAPTRSRTPAAPIGARRSSRVRTPGRTRSIPRDYDHYTADEAPQCQKFTSFKNNVKNNAFSGGVTRIPLLTEVMEVSKDIIEMRYKEIHLLEEAIEYMKQDKIEANLIQTMQKGLDILNWEMDDSNVRRSDLPVLGPETTNFADISTWLIFYFDLLHDNMHRIIDLNYQFVMLTKAHQKRLEKYDNHAFDIMERFEKTVAGFKLQGESARNYKSVTTEIRKNCTVCP